MTQESVSALSRRGMLGGSLAAAGAAAAVLLAPGQAFGVSAGGVPRRTEVPIDQSDPDSWSVRPFPLGAVTLGQSVFTRAQQQALGMYRAYPVDRMLAVFRRNAGLDVKGANPPGGWEEYGPNPEAQRWGPREYTRGQNTRGAGGCLRGHYGGHYLSGISMCYAATGEQVFLDKANAMVEGLEECRAALAAQEYDGAPRYSHPGFLSAYGEWQFSALEAYAPYGEIWAPYYTLHKITMGLLDAHLLTGNELALELAEGIGHWVHSRLSQCTESQLQRMWGMYIAGEYGGMNEALIELYWRSADPERAKFLEAAQLFTLDSLVDACAEERDTLDGKHANQHIPQFSGYAKMAAATGEERYLTATQNFFGMIVPGRMYAHGGTGEGEMWGPPDTVAGDIGPRNCESCAAYNMLKVARLLFFTDQDPAYMDYYERTLLNHILGGKRDRESTTGPENLYMFPVHPGAQKEYGNGNIGTCCGGTALESHVKYQESIYFRSKDDSSLYVNLYMSSTLVWEETGLVLEQASDYPEDELVTLTVVEAPADPLDVRLRIPGWVTAPVEVQVNGESVSGDLTPGTYATISRTWQDGDVITVRLPLALRIEAAIDRDDIQTLMYGPTVLTAMSSSTNYLKVALADRLDLTGTPVRGVEAGPGNSFSVGSLAFEPAYTGREARYHMYFQREEPTVTFAGSSAGVTNPRRGGSTLLDEIWTAAPFASRSEFLRAVSDVTSSFVDDGALTARNRQKILLAAGRAPIDAGQ